MFIIYSQQNFEFGMENSYFDSKFRFGIWENYIEKLKHTRLVLKNLNLTEMQFNAI